MQGLKKHWKWVVAIIAMQFITMGTVGVAPALAQIGAAFPDKSAEEIQLLMSIPSLGTVIASLVAVPVAARLGRRKSVSFLSYGRNPLVLLGFLGFRASVNP